MSSQRAAHFARYADRFNAEATPASEGAAAKVGRRRMVNRRWFALCSLVLVAWLPLSLLGQDTAGDMPSGVSRLDSVTLRSSDRYAFKSKSVDQTFLIDVVRVGSPFNPSPDPRRLPVVFVTDGNAFSQLVAGIAIAGSATVVPAMYIVGIGYHFDPSLSDREVAIEVIARRTRDLLPGNVSKEFTDGLDLFQQSFGVPRPDYMNPGGADAFLKFIDGELKPFIGAKYPVDVQDATLVGHSFGGVFALYVLFTSPTSFGRYIVVSPTAGVNGDLLFRLEAALGEISARLFMAVGGVQDNTQVTQRMDAQIRAHRRSRLEYSFQLFPDETHNSIMPVAVMRGLRQVLDPPGPPRFGPPPAGGRP
jgi:ferri-bacillibactin esterase